MSDPKDVFKKSLEDALRKVAPGAAVEVHVERPKNPEHGDLSSNVAMQLAKQLKKNPMELAKLLVAALPPGAEIAKPGFINVRVKAAAKLSAIAQALKGVNTEREAALDQAFKGIKTERQGAIDQANAAVSTQRAAIMKELDAHESKLAALLSDAKSVVARADQAGQSLSAATTQTVDTTEQATQRTLDRAFTLALILILVLLIGIPLSLILYRIAARRVPA